MNKIRVHNAVIILLVIAAWPQTASVQGREPAVIFSLEESRAVTVCDTAANHIADSSGALIPFMEKLQELRRGGENTVSILHIGDSHLQAGFVTERLRVLFQREFGSAGRGLIAPLKLAGWNQPSDYTISSPNDWTGWRCTGRNRTQPVGPTAMGIRTEDKHIAFTIAGPDDFSLVRVFHHPDAPSLNGPQELDPGFHCTAYDSGISTDILFSRPVSNVTLEGNSGGQYKNSTFYGFSLENGSPGILYHSVGINGASFDHFASCENFITSTRLLAPDLIIISLGTNDATGNGFEERILRLHIKKLVSALSEVNGDVPVLLTTPIESCRLYRRAYVVNDNIGRSAAVIRETASDTGAASWDFYTAATGKGANARWKGKGFFSRDMLHMTKEGYYAHAELFFAAFMEYYNQTLEGTQ